MPVTAQQKPMKNRSIEQTTNEEGDNSSSGVSSDQEVAIITKGLQPLPPLATLKLLETKNEDVIHDLVDGDCDDDDDRSPSPPILGFQRHNSMTRKQANTIAMTRVLQSRPAVSLIQLPPPIEIDYELDGQQMSDIPPPPPPVSVVQQQQQQHHHHHVHHHGHHNHNNIIGSTTTMGRLKVIPDRHDDDDEDDLKRQSDFIVLAPPPQFSDNNDKEQSLLRGGGGNVSSNNGSGVRIVGAVPKSSCLKK